MLFVPTNEIWDTVEHLDEKLCLQWILLLRMNIYDTDRNEGRGLFACMYKYRRPAYTMDMRAPVRLPTGGNDFLYEVQRSSACVLKFHG